MSQEVYYTQFLFRVYADGRKERITEVYLKDGSDNAVLLDRAPQGAIADAALSAVQVATNEGLLKEQRPRPKRRVRI